ncbi:hypothetical protein [Poriferisphaera sp. WC338]|uniref:hypothetical protein n=1 Tax=Poriferisphaera sp. WC338 TaxID=3425129 RepID=UPI003D81C028
MYNNLSHSGRLPYDQPIPHNIHCSKCDYNLRTLFPIFDCPECGQPISLTLQHQHLLLAPPHHLRAFRRSITLLITTIILLILFEATRYFLSLTISPIFAPNCLSTHWLNIITPTHVNKLPPSLIHFYHITPTIHLILQLAFLSAALLLIHNHPHQPHYPQRLATFRNFILFAFPFSLATYLYTHHNSTLLIFTCTSLLRLTNESLFYITLIISIRYIASLTLPYYSIQRKLTHTQSLRHIAHLLTILAVCFLPACHLTAFITTAAYHTNNFLLFDSSLVTITYIRPIFFFASITFALTALISLAIFHYNLSIHIQHQSIPKSHLLPTQLASN